MRYPLLGAALFVAGCASSTVNVNGQQMARLDLEYIGQPFAVRASGAHPQPGSPSGGVVANGGRVSGNVCGLDVTFDVDHVGDKTRLTGFIDDGKFQSSLEVRDAGNSRLITGRLSDHAGGVNLDLRKNHVFGSVGPRSFALARRGDQYIGTVRISASFETAATINGADELWALPPATQAVVLPTLLTCYGDELEANVRGSLVVGFGGRQTWEGKSVSALYHTATGDQQRAIMNGSRSGMQAGGAIQ